MKVVVAGSSGLVGAAFVTAALVRGHEVVCLRRPESVAEFRHHDLEGLPTGLSFSSWDPGIGICDTRVLEAADAVVNLCGANIGERRWTAARKRLLWDSRVHSTRCLVGAIERCHSRPRVFVSASAIGYYGSRGDLLLDEKVAPGKGFLASLCVAWEAEALRLEASSVRVVVPRLGMVLAGKGGALARLVPLFRSGLGGPLGDGKSWMSWIGLEDLVEALLFCIQKEDIEGPVNMVSPEPLRNRDFATALGAALHRPVVVPAPAFALKLALGELAEELLLASQRVESAVLTRSGFKCRTATLSEALSVYL